MGWWPGGADSDFRNLALDSLARVVEKNHEQATAMIYNWLEDPSTAVKEAAVDERWSVSTPRTQRRTLWPSSTAEQCVWLHYVNWVP